MAQEPPPLRLFPNPRPQIIISPFAGTPFAVDCRELQWWFAIPLPNESTFHAAYDAPTGQLDILRRLVGVCPAKIHGIPCVKIEITEWRADWGWQAKTFFHYCTLTETETDWVAIVSSQGGVEVLETIKDPGFEGMWGKKWKHNGCRKKACTGRYATVAPGVYHTSQSMDSGEGFYTVQIGGLTHECIRVLDIGERADENSEMNEVYLNRGGRTVYRRQFPGRKMGFHGVTADAFFPDAEKIMIDGCMYVHCDCTKRSHEDIFSASLALPAQQPDTPGPAC